MQSIEFQIQQTNGQITDNFEEIKAYLDVQLDEYRAAVFNDDSIKMAKAVVADLRKQQKAVKERISDVKRFYMKPFDEWKSKADELVRLYDEPIVLINSQVEDYIERQQNEKREYIKGIYDGLFGDMPEITLDSIFDGRWLNATYTKKNVERDLIDIHTKINNDLMTINSFRSDAVPEATKMYYATRELSNSIAYIQRYEQTRAEVIEKEREKEIERAKMAEREKIQAVEVAKSEAIDAYIPNDDGTPVIDYVYGIKLNDAMRESLEMYMDSVGIEWEVLNG